MTLRYNSKTMEWEGVTGGVDIQELDKRKLIPLTRFLVTAQIGRDKFRRTAYSVKYALELFNSYTEDKSTEVLVFSWNINEPEITEPLAKSRRGKVHYNNLEVKNV